MMIRAGILLLISSVWLASAEEGPKKRDDVSTSFRRELQAATNPCVVPFEEASLTTFDGKTYLRSSFFEDCVNNLEVDLDNMVQHLSNLRETFKQYYAFYNIVNDPSLSEPQGHQPELGYSIFGVGEGQLRLDEMLNQLIDSLFQASGGGATGATFWRLAEIFNGLRDAHVVLPTYLPESVAAGVTVWVYPARTLAGGPSQTGQAIIDYDPNGTLRLSILWRDTSGMEAGTDGVETINGQSPYEFFETLSNSNSIQGLEYQSEGARFNAMFNMQADAADTPAVFVFGVNGAPSGVLPETFTVTYEGGGQTELFYSVVQHSAYDAQPLYDQLVTNLAGVWLNSPGKAYISFQEAVRGVANVTSGGDRRRTASLQKRQRSAIEEFLDRGNSQRRMQTDAYQFDKTFTADPDSDVPVAAFKISDDYAVLKLENYAIMPELAREIWSETVEAAKAKEVKKLMVDISNNGGGTAQSGDTLAISMYPYTDYEWFVDQWDIKLNAPMFVWNDTVQPIVDAFASVESVLNATDLSEWAASFTPEQLNALQGIVPALVGFCDESCVLGNSQCDPERCAFLNENLLSAVNQFVQFPSPPQLVNLIETIVEAMGQFNPWTVVDDGQVNTSVVRTLNRGGIPTELSNQVTFLSRDWYLEAVSNAFQLGYFFEEYVLVSNGAGGSTTAIFASKVEQIWKNREQSGATIPVTTVSYGGNNKPGGTTMAGFPASVQDTHLEYPLIADGLLLMLEQLFPKNLTEIVEILQSIRENYEAVLPVPGYFGNTLTYMPVVNYYSKFMDPGALPLQYVKMPSDEHIPRVFTQVSISSPGHLEELYSEAAKFFGDGAGPPPTTDPPRCVIENGRCKTSGDCCDDMGCYAREQKPNNRKCKPCALVRANCEEDEECCDFPVRAKCDQLTLKCVRCRGAGKKCRSPEKCCSSLCEDGFCL